MRNEIHANDLLTHTVQWTTVAVVIVSSLKAYHSCISSNILRWLLFVTTNLDCFSINNNKGLFEPVNHISTELQPQYDIALTLIKCTCHAKALNTFNHMFAIYFHHFTLINYFTLYMLGIN